MIDLYNIDDGIRILEKKKKITTYFIISGILLTVFLIVITSLSNSYFIMLVDVLLTVGYLWVLYTYIFYIRKLYNERYHFLAKVEQYKHEEIDGTIVEIEEEITTIKKMETYALNVSGRIVYIECDKRTDAFVSGTHIKAEVVDNFIVGYEVILNA